MLKTLKGQGGKKKIQDLSWRENPVEERLAHALIRGIVDYIDEDVENSPPKVSSTFTGY